MLFGKKNKAVLRIGGMHCEKCSGKVAAALKAIGVNADVDLKLGRANVTYPAKVEMSTIVSAVTALGFTCEEIK
ncbi:MAG: heavy-metal-associated domain-containing protein [Clostridia bacterium]|nr:heavy-metal-associated domain-containing protein [Clostridia bacterium]